MSRKFAAYERFMKGEANSEYMENDMKAVDISQEEVGKSALQEESREIFAVTYFSMASKGIPSRFTNHNWTFTSSIGKVDT